MQKLYIFLAILTAYNITYTAESLQQLEKTIAALNVRITALEKEHETMTNEIKQAILSDAEFIKKSRGPKGERGLPGINPKVDLRQLAELVGSSAGMKDFKELYRAEVRNDTQQELKRMELLLKKLQEEVISIKTILKSSTKI